MIGKCKNLRFNLTNNMRDLIIEIVIINEILKEKRFQNIYVVSRYLRYCCNSLDFT